MSFPSSPRNQFKKPLKKYDLLQLILPHPEGWSRAAVAELPFPRQSLAPRTRVCSGSSACALKSPSAANTNGIIVTLESLSRLTGWGKWTYRAGITFSTLQWNHYDPERPSSHPPLPISRYTIAVASQLLSEFEMKASIYLYAVSCLPLPYKNVHWNKDCVFCISYCIQITLKMFAE